MAVQDLWRDRHGQPTKRDGRGLRWRVSVPGHPTRSFATKQAAQRHERVLWATGPASEDERTMSTLLDLWVASKAGLTRRAHKNCVMAAAVARSRWGDVVARDVVAHEVQAWLPEVGGVDWRRKVLQAVRGAAAIGGVELGKVSVGTTHERPSVFLTVAQVSKLAGAVGARYAPMVWLLATTGVRIGECVRLLVGDVDVERSRLRVRRAKGGRPREAPIPASVLAMLDLDREASEPLFLGHHKGQPPSADAFRQKVFHPAAAASVLPEGLRIHDLRHTAASLMIMSGATVKDVQAALGHKSAAMTLDLYSGWWDTGLDDVGARMDALVRGGRTESLPASSG